MLDITPAQQAGLLARGAKPYSDLDITLFGLRPEDGPALAHLRADLEECSLPWRVDISDADDLPSALRDLVTHSGVLLQGQPVSQESQT